MIYKAGTPQHFTPITVHDSAWFKDTLGETHILNYLPEVHTKSSNDLPNVEQEK